MPISDLLIQKFMLAAGMGAALELRIRLLCGAVPTLVQFSTARVLEKAEEAICDHFAINLSNEEVKTLRSARQLRNKILHADFQVAHQKLREVGLEASSPVVRAVHLDETSILEKIREIAMDPRAAGYLVTDAKSTAEGTVFGWLMEFGLTGEFEIAAELFAQATDIIDRLTTVNSRS